MGHPANEPAHLVHTARFLATQRDMDYETFAEQTAANTRQFFSLSTARST